jgi:DNA replication ATP-dependent helicase Dna2
VSVEQYRRAVAEEFEAAKRYVEVRVASLYQGGHFVQMHLDLNDTDGRVDETLEGAVAWWAPSGTADVLSYLPEQELLNLRFVKGALPQVGDVVRLYPPRYLDSLHELWQTMHAHEFAEFAAELSQRWEAGPELVFNLVYPWLREAQERAFDLLRWPVSYLWGPPGTGKTTTIGCMLASVLEQEPEARVLLLANTNVAVDQALVAVDDQLEDLALRRSCRRVGAHFGVSYYAGRLHLLPNQSLELLTSIAELEALVPARGAVEQYAAWKVQHEELRDKMRVSLEGLLEKSRLVAMTTTRALYSWELLARQQFDYVVFDESSQVPLVAALPLGVLGRRVLFAGDPNQLAPIAQTRGNVFGDSPFARLDANGPNACFLNEQSRMAPAICETISRVFYSGRLVVAKTAVDDARWLTERGAFDVAPYGARHAYLIPVEGEAKWVPSASGWIRKESAEQVLAVVRQLLQHVAAEEILILTPFRGQRNYLRRKLRELGLHGVRLSTVHRAQGAESNTVIFDPVQTSSRFLGDDLSLSRRLVNVALSRAKARVLLFASSSDLRHPVIASIAREMGRLPEAVAHILSVLERPEAAVGGRYLLPVSTMKLSPVKVLGLDGEMLAYEEDGVERRTMLGHLRRRVGWLQSRTALR